MLSRTAADLYWMGRYMERAESLARILEVGYRMSQTPDSDGTGTSRNEWESTAVAAGCVAGLAEKYGDATLDSVIRHLVLDEDNPSSIQSCLKTARTNGRAVRPALTAESWESLNDSWLDFTANWQRSLGRDNILAFLEWVKARTTLFRGATLGTMVRDEAFSFVELGTFIERADNTARILDVKYHVVLPAGEAVGGPRDYYQWATLLRSVSALGSYHWIYRDSIQPWLVAELLILRPEMPRSLIFALSQVRACLDAITSAHKQNYNCLRLAGRLHAEIGYAKIEDIIRSGLHEYLSEFLARNDALGNEIAADFHFYQ